MWVSEWVSQILMFGIFSWWAVGHVHSKNLRRSFVKVKGHLRCIPFCGMLGSCCHVRIGRGLIMSNKGSQSCVSAVCFTVSGTRFAERSVSIPKLPLVFLCRPRRHGGEKKRKRNHTDRRLSISATDPLTRTTSVFPRLCLALPNHCCLCKRRLKTDAFSAGNYRRNDSAL